MTFVTGLFVYRSSLAVSSEGCACTYRRTVFVVLCGRVVSSGYFTLAVATFPFFENHAAGRILRGCSIAVTGTRNDLAIWSGGEILGVRDLICVNYSAIFTGNTGTFLFKGDILVTGRLSIGFLDQLIVLVIVAVSG